MFYDAHIRARRRPRQSAKPFCLEPGLGNFAPVLRVVVLPPMATTFNDKSVALPVHLLCIIPKVGMKNLSFYLPAINEILNEIAVAIYHILWQFIITFRQRYQGDFITFRQEYHCDFISPG
jgi:hypothetical protein